MDARWFVDDEMHDDVDLQAGLPTRGFVWMSWSTEEAQVWPMEVERLTGLRITPEHVSDSFNRQHSPFYDGTLSYDMLIFQELLPSEDPKVFHSRPLVFFLMDRLLVTLHGPESQVIEETTRRIRDRKFRTPRRPAGLMQRMLSAAVDRYLQRKQPLMLLIAEWQNQLLNPSSPFDDWMTILKSAADFRRLESECEMLATAVRSWRDETSVEIDEALAVRYTDLVEHVGRVLLLAQTLQHQIESVVQMHFAATAHRTNNIMKVLTVVSAIFLPLSLVAGIFGMNFQHMPELEWPYAYPIALCGMSALGIGLYLSFKRRRWV